jgi:hypothetical protein
MASCTYHVRRTLIRRVAKILGMSLEASVFDVLPSVNQPFGRHKNRFLRAERGHGGGIIVVDSLGILLNEGINLPAYLWIGYVSMWHF